MQTNNFRVLGVPESDIYKQLILCFILRWKIEKIVDSDCRFGKNLNGLCAIGSTALQQTFTENGIQDSQVMIGKFLGDYHHCWLEQDNVVYDITATQFSMVKHRVFVVKKGSSDYKAFYKLGEEVSDIASSFKNWPKFQIPNEEFINAIQIQPTICQK